MCWIKLWTFYGKKLDLITKNTRLKSVTLPIYILILKMSVFHIGLIWTLQLIKFASTIKIYWFRQASMPMGILQQCIALELEPIEVGKFNIFQTF